MITSFPWPIPTASERQQLLRDALSPLSVDNSTRLFAVLDHLFALILTESELLHRDADNPVEHHTTVLGHMMEIAVGEGLTWEETRRAAAISILHDNWPARKVTYEVREGAATRDERVKLDEINRKRRVAHMMKGSENAQRRLRELNEQLQRVEFTDDAIEAICGVIAVHDNPNIGKTIPESNRLAMSFREADRLWMQSPAGVRADLARKGIPHPTHRQCANQADQNLRSYRAERALYGPGAQGFLDNETPFRTATGHEIFKKYRLLWAATAR